MLDLNFGPYTPNPFGLTNVYASVSSPTFVDINGDGLLDIFSGDNSGNIDFFKNTGTNSTPAFAARTLNPFGLTSVRYPSRPTFVDINGDGTLDAFVGDGNGNIEFFKNTGTKSVPAFAPAMTNSFGLTSVGSYSVPTLIDINGDGTLDAFVGDAKGDIVFFKNTGTNIAPAFAAPVTNPFNFTNVGSFSSPTFVDINGDGILDNFTTNLSGDTFFFQNTGTNGNPVFAPAVKNPFGFDHFPGIRSLTFVDINGTLNAVNGYSAPGSINFRQATGLNTIPVFAPYVQNPFGLTDVSGGSSPTFVDINGDGTLDALVGTFDGNIVFFKNTGTNSVPAFAPAITNPFGLSNVGTYIRPTLIDINGDGTLDAFVGDAKGDIVFLKNTGTNNVPAFAPAITNPFGLSNVGTYIRPTFIDINGDGTLDAFVGDAKGDIVFFKNTGTNSVPAFAPAVTNPFGLINIGYTGGSTPTFVKINGTIDFFTGNGNGGILFSQNTGTNSTPAFTPYTLNPFDLIYTGGDSIPTLVDIDGNGTLDAFVGNQFGNTIFFKSILQPATNTSSNDFNGNGTSDILWRNNDGSVAMWQMNGAAVVSSRLTSTLDSSWKTAGTGDFNGDRKTDILWRNDNGAVALWQMNGSTITTSSIVSTVSADWKIAGIGDFNSDGKSDILWRNDNGSVALWQMDGSTVVSSSLTSTPSLDPSWKIAGTGDFNGDGKSDILWRNDNGSVALWQMNGAVVTASTAVAMVSKDWKINGTGDFNGDGKSDIIWRNDNGSVALWQMNGASIVSSSFTSTPSVDNSWKITGTGDFNGDGKSDILWRNDLGTTSVWQMNGATVVSASLTSVPSVDNSWKIAAPIF